LEHDFVPPEDRQRPRRIVESEERFANDLYVLTRGVVAKFGHLLLNQGIVGGARKADDDYARAW
jgi:hypothetical protein